MYLWFTLLSIYTLYLQDVTDGIVNAKEQIKPMSSFGDTFSATAEGPY